jgi:hypothetical protein
MNNLIKIGSVIVIVALSVSLLWTWFKVFVVGMYYDSASIFLTAVVGLAPLVLLVLTYFGIKKTLKFKI